MVGEIMGDSDELNKATMGRRLEDALEKERPYRRWWKRCRNCSNFERKDAGFAQYTAPGYK
jgi:hypothetical protein